MNCLGDFWQYSVPYFWLGFFLITFKDLLCQCVLSSPTILSSSLIHDHHSAVTCVTKSKLSTSSKSIEFNIEVTNQGAAPDHSYSLKRERFFLMKAMLLHTTAFLAISCTQKFCCRCQSSLPCLRLWNVSHHGPWILNIRMELNVRILSQQNQSMISPLQPGDQPGQGSLLLPDALLTPEGISLSSLWVQVSCRLTHF